jgi:2-amino-4-hydroxy-6-hydroxymethyldihydropteridine diphosphokinase
MGPADQPNFLNAAVCVASALGLGSLLQHVKAVERTLGRVERERWREREVDLDLLAAVEDGPFRGLALEPALEVPHNGLWNRPFVLAPLMDLRDLMPGDLRSSVEEAWGRQAECGGRPVWRVEEAGWFRSN